MTTPEVGAVEFDGTKLYISISGGTRKEIAFVELSPKGPTVDPLASLALLIADLHTQIRALQDEIVRLRADSADNV